MSTNNMNRFEFRSIRPEETQQATTSSQVTTAGKIQSQIRTIS